MRPVFWSFRRCPYAMRARLAVTISQTKVELREILLRDKPAQFVTASPKATVPVLQLPDGHVIEESLDVMMWALRRNDPEGWLACMEANPEKVSRFFERLDGPFKHHLDRYKYASRYDKEAALIHRQEGAEILAEFNAILASQPALSGEDLGLLDFGSLPFVRQFRIADPEWFDAEDWPHLQAWLMAFLDSSLFAAVMKKYAPWENGEKGIDFPLEPA